MVFLVAAVLAGAGWIGQAIGEENAAPPPRGQRDPEQMRQRMEQFRQQMGDRMKQALGVNDDEWKVLQPKIEKVQTLARQTRGGIMGGMGGAIGGMFGRRNRPGGEADANRPPDANRQPDPNRPPPSEVEKKAQALQKVLENKEAKPEEIKTALAALREARAKARQALETAQKELREVVTVRQEAQLVTMSILE
jgi:uncharacterized membrane protein